MISIMDEVKIALHGIWQRRWLAMAAAWALCLLGWLVVSFIPNSYESQARMLVEVTDVLPADGSPPVDVRQRLDQLRQTINSARNLEQVAIQSGMIDRAADERTRADAVVALQDAVEVTAQQDNIFELTVTIGGGGRSDANNAQLATRVVESMIAVFQDEQIRGGTASAQQRIRFLDGQITEVEGRMRQAETARSQFESRNFGLLPGAASATSRLTAARAEISQIETQLVSAQSSLASVNQQISLTPPTINLPAIGSTGVSMVRQQLASAEAELASMRARGLTAVHPDVMALQAQIQALRAQVQREPAAGGGGSSQPNPSYQALVTRRSELQGQAAGLQARRAQLNGEIAGMTARQTQEPAIAAEYERLNRDYNVFKEQYDRLVAQRERIRIQGSSASSGDAIRVEILDEPTRPRSPAAPNRPLLLLGVLLAGLAGGIGTAFAMSQLQTTYPTAARLAKASGLPVVGSITEILTDELVSARRAKLRRFALAGVGLAAVCAVLLAVEYVQVGMVG
jgi:polysaccharide chain length determinant protein (PEP-CTERM system associated)